MIKKLSGRTHGGVDGQEMGRMLDEGELKQISIEFVGVVDAKVSTEFAQNYLGRSPKQQGRRNAGSDGHRLGARVLADGYQGDRCDPSM